MDTVEANHALGFPPDMREYGESAEMLRLLRIKSVALITNNPDKIGKLSASGIKISRRIPHEFGKTEHNRGYLRVKKSKMSHLLSDV